MVKITIDNDRAFRDSLKNASKKISDFTIPFGLIAQSWFKSNKSIFLLKGPGRYEDYKSKSTGTKGKNTPYAKMKLRVLGQVYPMLRFSGTLEESITNPESSGAINLIINKNILYLGTSVTTQDGVPYPFFLQHGTKKMPARPAVLIGSEQVANPALNMRVKRWSQMIDKFVTDSVKGMGTVNGR